MGKKTRKTRLQPDKPWDNLYKELQGESERAAAVVGGAMIDYVLYQLLSQFFVDDETEIKDLFDSSSGPIATLNAKIALCYCLGLITEEQKDALTAIRKTRNHFAHQLHDASFADQPVRDFSSQLKSYGQFITNISQPSPRDYFQVAVGMLVYVLGIQAMKTERRQKLVSPTMQELLQNIGLGLSAAEQLVGVS